MEVCTLYLLACQLSYRNDSSSSLDLCCCVCVMSLHQRYILKCTEDELLLEFAYLAFTRMPGELP